MYSPLEEKRRAATLEHLTLALQQAGTGIAYTEFDDDGRTVVVQYLGGGTRRVNVNGDSPLGIIMDVVRYGV